MNNLDYLQQLEAENEELRKRLAQAETYNKWLSDRSRIQRDYFLYIQDEGIKQNDLHVRDKIKSLLELYHSRDWSTFLKMVCNTAHLKQLSDNARIITMVKVVYPDGKIACRLIEFTKNILIITRIEG